MEIAFIRTILPLILNNTINKLHPELVQRIVEYLQTSAQFAQLDCCITKLDISCLDLDQVGTSWFRDNVGGIAYVWLYLPSVFFYISRNG